MKYLYIVLIVFHQRQCINNDLNTAFPGRTGKGRYTNGKKIGSNWLTIDEDENKNTKRIFDILSNMVYAQEPAYHIVLDTGKINYIRKKNAALRNASPSKDPYNYSGEFNCVQSSDSPYGFCSSGFLTELFNKGYLEGDVENECLSRSTPERSKACRQS